MLCSPNTDSPSSLTTGSPRQLQCQRCSAWRSPSACASIVAVTTAAPYMGQRRCACSASTSAARSALDIPRRSLQLERRMKGGPTTSPGRRESSQSQRGQKMNWHTSRRSSGSGAPVTSAKPCLFHPRPRYAISVDISDALNARASLRSCRSGRLVILGIWNLIATPKLRNNWRSSGAHGESHGKEFDGNVNNARLRSSTGHHSVPDAAMNAATSALDPRKCCSTFYMSGSHNSQVTGSRS